jgi:hypothetical protein
VKMRQKEGLYATVVPLIINKLNDGTVDAFVINLQIYRDYNRN